MFNKRNTYQDGGSVYDTSSFSEAIDDIESIGYMEDEEENELEPVEQAIDDTDAEINDEFDEEPEEQDIFEMMLNDDSFELPISNRVNRETNSYARIEQKREAIGKSQLERNQKAYDFYLNMGLNKVQAAAIVGNLAQESGIRPLNYGDRDSKGVAQWRTDRYKPMIAWAKTNGKDPNALETQLEYVAVEANQRGDLQRIANHEDIVQATIDFGRKYERPSEQHANWNSRANHAASVYRMYGGDSSINQYGNTGSFKVPQPEVFKVKQNQNSPNKNLLREELSQMVGGKELTQIIPITSEPDYLTVKRMTGTGQYELPDAFKMFNNLAQGTNFISNLINSQRRRRREQEILEEDSRRPAYDNFGINGISNIPSYNI